MYVAGSSSVIYLYKNMCVLSSFLGRRTSGSRVYEFEAGYDSWWWMPLMFCVFGDVFVLLVYIVGDHV